MSLRHVCSAIAAAAFVSGVLSAGPAYAQRRDGALLPQEQGGEVTVVGCLLRGDAVRGGNKGKFVIAHPKRGPVENVAEAACSADSGADALTLDNGKKMGVTDAMVGRWVEITGRLEKETSKNPDNLREIEIAAIKPVPVAIPQAAAPPPPPAIEAPLARAPEPVPAPLQEAEPVPEPVATTGELSQTTAPEALPKTASPMPLLGFFGLLSLAGGFLLARRRG
jgi:LPXTG-motif cell wall-anchored protein